MIFDYPDKAPFRDALQDSGRGRHRAFQSPGVL
jgi:hypothetical protein